MLMQRVLIAETSEEFGAALANLLVDTFAVQRCADGLTAMELMERFSPDVLVLDLMLPRLDGLGMLEEVRRVHPECDVMVTTRFVSDFVLAGLERLGVHYLMIEPCNLNSAAQRVRELAEASAGKLPRTPDPRSAASNLLRELGISTRRRGFVCLREAVLLYVRDPMQSVTKELYPAVGRICGCNPAQAERVIRLAIQAACDTPTEQWQQVFGHRGQSGRPSNGLFIARAAEILLSGEI